MTLHQTIPEWPDPHAWDDEDPTTTVPGPDPTTLTTADPATQTALIQDYLRREIAALLHTDPEQLDTHHTLLGLGIGSMTGVELQRRIHHTLKVEIDLKAVLLSPGITALATHTTQALTTQTPTTTTPATTTQTPTTPATTALTAPAGRTG